MKKDVFVPRSANAMPGLNMAMVLGLKQDKIVAGEVGIEIEIEGKNLPSVTQQHAPAPWVYKADHSLRGDETGEYILKAPIAFSAVPGALAKLWDHFEKCKTTILDSNRTSIHVHLNCQKFHLNRLVSLAALHFIVEEILTEWCGEHRVGNLFCLRSKDAEAIITWMKRFVQQDGECPLPDGLHYAGFNAQALAKFGSIEIRTLRGVSSPNVIQDWVAIYERLYKLSGEFSDPTQICELFSMNGPTAFFERILGPKAYEIKKTIGWSSDEITDSMYASVRRAQDLCYCRDWAEFKTLDVSDNPFGYGRNRLVQKAMAATGMSVAEPLVHPEEPPYDPEPEYDDLPMPDTVNLNQYFSNNPFGN